MKEPIKAKGIKALSERNLKKEEITTRELFSQYVNNDGYKIVEKQFNSKELNINYLVSEVYKYDIGQGKNFEEFKESFKLLTHKGPKKIKLPFIVLNKSHSTNTSFKDIPNNCFLEFASTELSKSGILSFAQKYGLLGFDCDSNYKDINFFNAIRGESLMKWFYEIWYMKRVLKMWSHCWDEKKLMEKHFIKYIAEDGTHDMDYNEEDGLFYEDGEAFTDAALLCTHNIYPESDIPPKDMSESNLVGTASLEDMSEGSLQEVIEGFDSKRIQTGYLDHITNLINIFLGKRNFNFRTMAVDDSFNFRFIEKNEVENVVVYKNEQKKMGLPRIKRTYNAENLISELWCQCAEFLSSQSRVQQCIHCDNFYMDKRGDSKFCSNLCRVKYFNSKNKGRKK